MDDRRVHGERTVQQDRLEKKVRVESFAGAESVCLCVIRKEQENRQGGRRERKLRRDRGSMCMLFSRQPRECLSSAAPFTLSQPEGRRAGSLQSQREKHATPHWPHRMHTLWSQLTGPDLALITCQFLAIYIRVQKYTGVRQTDMCSI